MSQRFLLPCSCGRTIPVGISQAGSSVTCECGQAVAVPTIRGLKALRPEKEDAPPLRSAPVSEVNGVNLQGAMFVLGFLMLLGGLALGGYYGYLYSRIDTTDRGEEYAAYFNGEIDKLNVSQLYSTWKYLEHEGIGDYQPAEHILARQAAAFALKLAIGGGVVAAVGLALVGYSLASGSSVRRST